MAVILVFALQASCSIRAGCEHLPVFEQVLHEFLYADDCALEAHSQHDIQLITDKFAEAAKKYGLAINTKKTEVMF